MLYGILTAQSCHLSKIARALDEKTSLKKVIDRLSRNLNDYENSENIFLSYINAVKPLLKDNSILVVDGSDIVKPCSEKMECLCKVRDGSTGKYGNGYFTLGVTALTPKHKMSLPVYSRIYTSTEQSFVSEDEETLNCLKMLSNNFKKGNIRAFDRGYDCNTYYDYLIKNEEKFIIRAKKNRDVLYNGERINIMDLANTRKGKYGLKFKNKAGKKVDCKISIIPISLPCKPNAKLNLVVCYGFGKKPMILITSLNSDDERLSVAVVKVYLMRWRIEEFYKFKKQQFNFEDLRVRSLNSIRNLDLFLTIAIGHLGIMSEKAEQKRFVLELIELSKRIYDIPKFIYYAIADGIFALLNKCKKGIDVFLKKPPKSMQLSLFKDEGFGIV